MSLDPVNDRCREVELMRVPRPAEAFAARVEAEMAEARRRALASLPVPVVDPVPVRLAPSWRRRRAERLGVAA